MSLTLFVCFKFVGSRGAGKEVGSFNFSGLDLAADDAEDSVWVYASLMWWLRLAIVPNPALSDSLEKNSGNYFKSLRRLFRLKILWRKIESFGKEYLVRWWGECLKAADFIKIAIVGICSLSFSYSTPNGQKVLRNSHLRVTFLSLVSCCIRIAALEITRVSGHSVCAQDEYACLNIVSELDMFCSPANENLWWVN